MRTLCAIISPVLPVSIGIFFLSCAAAGSVGPCGPNGSWGGLYLIGYPVGVIGTFVGLWLSVDRANRHHAKRNKDKNPDEEVMAGNAARGPSSLSGSGGSPKMRYEEIPTLTREVVEQALRDDVPEVLLRVVIAVSMHDDDGRYAQDLCVRLSAHSHFNVRGNAVLGFGHIARVHGQLDRALVQPIIQAALRDESDYVRGQADSAMDDTAMYLGWHYDEKERA